ncbi:CrcB protein [Salmonella enterica subsp. enterica]|uniref:Fluoride-specific ion channel n=1 Tax=Salmonella enterica I TaxID=59201 RepID=A0A3S5DN52_SALET|nr:CrcB protein [Salmonella enterica subsp. enterica]
MLQLLLAVFIGGGTGSVARWMLSMRFNPLHQAIPIGTLTANLLGAFIIGMGFAWFNRMTHIDPMWKVLITTGFLRRPDDLFYFFCRSGILAARGALWLGAAECAD